MPLFSRSAFKAGKKPGRRKSSSLGNLSTLDESTYSINDLKLDSSGPLTMKLGGYEFNFEKGQWTIASKEGGVTVGSKEYLQLQKENTQLQEENNLLKYKVELLLDMITISNADNYALREELETAKKATYSKVTKKKQSSKQKTITSDK